MSEDALYISLEAKNRKILKGMPFEVVEAIQINNDYEVDPIPSYNLLKETVLDIMKKSKHQVVVIDGISDIPRWAEKVVIKEIQKKHPENRTIGKENLAGWAARNNLAYMPMERMAMWAEVKDRIVIATTLMTDEYFGEKKVGVCVDAKPRLRKIADVRVMLTNDGRGHLAHFEKMPVWAAEGKSPMAIGKGELAVEFSKRGILSQGDENNE